jgi:glycosyltransferase involved in cell wall biosynthesis
MIKNSSDDEFLKTVYSAVDVVVMPSKLEAFGLVAQEAQACGSLVVAFDTGGLSDIVKHLETGYLAKISNIEDLSNGLLWALQNKDNQKMLNICRDNILINYDQSLIADKYISIYKSMLL